MIARCNFPGVVQVESAGDWGNGVPQELGAAEGLRVDGRKDVGEELDAAAQGFVEQLFFSGDELVLGEGVVQSGGEEVLGAGFSEETEDVAFINHADSGFKVGVAGEHDADGVGGALAEGGQELDAIHAGHLAVGDNDGIGAVLREPGQGGFAAIGGFEIEVAA